MSVVRAGGTPCAAESSMDSINRNQSEENRADLAGAEAVAKIRELVKSAQTCFFCTAATPAGGANGAGRGR